MDEQERRDRQMIELLNELRIALPGVQILFGFLLTVPFAQGFQRVTATQKGLFYASLLATIASTMKSTGTQLKGASARPNCGIGMCWWSDREIVRRK